nr:hypothetical protein [Tanacetum cinerariifolium]
ENVYKEWEDRMEKAATTASSLKVEQDSGNINRTQSMATLNEPLPQGTGFGSGPRYALTVNPTVYASRVKQFWTTAKVKKVNVQEHIQALVDKQKVIVTEESIRLDFKFDDAKGTACLPNDTIFEELARMRQGQGFSRNVTPLFETMMVIAQEEVEKEIAKLKKKVKKLGKRRKSRPAGLRRLKKVGSSKQVESSEEKDSLGAQEDASK